CLHRPYEEQFTASQPRVLSFIVPMKNSSPLPSLVFCPSSGDEKQFAVFRPNVLPFNTSHKKSGESSPQLVSRSLHRQ
ncbi:hypothetical protein P9210_11075, partial [Heyndrickxia coagulans]|nr:hypothetical protein [Heyndrickxia coagulans]